MVMLNLGMAVAPVQNSLEDHGRVMCSLVSTASHSDRFREGVDHKDARSLLGRATVTMDIY